MSRLAAAAAALWAGVAFAPVLRAGFVNWDDPGNIIRNPWLGTLDLGWQAFASTHYGHFQPLAWLSLGLDRVAGGGGAFAFHFTAVALHALSAAALCLLLRDLLKDVAATDAAKNAAALLAASLWAAHPLRVEAVAWATERRELLAVLALLVSARCYAAGRRRAAFAAFTLAALSKVTAAVFPLVLLAFDHWRGELSTRSDLRARLREKAPYLGVGLVVLALGVRAQAVSGTAVPLSVFGVLDRLAQAAYGPGYYLWKTVCPWNLSPFVYVDWREEAARFAPCALLSLLFAASWWRARRERGAAAFHAAVFAFLLPSLGFFKSGPQTAADRFFHMASVPLSIAAAFALVRRPAARLAAAVAATALLPLTRAQCAVWADSVSLWTRAFDSVARPTPLVLQNLATALREAGREAEAAPLFARLAAASPGSPAAFALRGDERFEAGDFAAAESSYSQALALNADLPAVRVNRGLARHRLGRYLEAEADFARAAEQDPLNADAWHNLGVILARRGARVSADEALERALALAPGRPDTLRVRALLQGAK